METTFAKSKSIKILMWFFLPDMIVFFYKWKVRENTLNF